MRLPTLSAHRSKCPWHWDRRASRGIDRPLARSSEGLRGPDVGESVEIELKVRQGKKGGRVTYLEQDIYRQAWKQAQVAWRSLPSPASGGWAFGPPEGIIASRVASAFYYGGGMVGWVHALARGIARRSELEIQTCRATLPTGADLLRR